MKNHHEVGHFKNRLMIVLLSLFSILVMAGQSFAATTCSSCHGMPPLDSANGTRVPSTGAFKGSHQKHMGATANPEACNKCHGNTNYNSTHAATSAYMIQMKSNVNNSPAIGTYSRTAPFPQSSAQNPTLGNCSNVNCHFEKNTTNRTPAPVWGNTTPAVDCSFCHESQPGTASHPKHLSAVAGGAAITCASCHPNYGATNFSHATSAGKHPIIVNMSNNYGGVGVTNIDWLPSQLPNSNFGSCTTYCHSDGTVPGSISTKWGNTSTGCDFCHPNLRGKHSAHVNLLNFATATYGSTVNNSAGIIYAFGCGNCHPTDISKHINGTVDITLNSNHTGPLKSKNSVANDTTGYTQNVGVSVTCAAAYCHSNGMSSPTFYGAAVDWYEASYAGDKCARCHGNSPGTGGKVGSAAHSAHVVGIHFDDIFNGVSKKLIISGGNTVNAAHGRNNRSTTISCNICHYATVTSSANDKNVYCSGCHDGATPPGGYKNLVYPLTVNTANHVNGTVDVSFINQKIATKAQVAASAFNGYTAANAGGWTRNSNGMKFKTYTSSYDVTKTTLLVAAAPYTTANGCQNVACHASITVKWNDTVTCTNCHTRLR